MAPALNDLADMTAAPLEEVAFAIAAEFRAVDAEGARANLDRLAERAAPVAALRPQARAQGLLDSLTGRDGFGAVTCGCPEGLMLDRVLDLRRGHPLSLCVVHVAVARRLGFELHVVARDRVAMVGDPSTRPPLVIDPVPGGRAIPASLRWLCPHVVGSTMLTMLTERFAERGSIGEAIRAAELRRAFPLAAENRSRHRAELRALRARLN